MRQRTRGDNADNSSIRRVGIEEGFESVCLMDRYLCRVPNPDPQEFKLYEAYALMEARKAYVRYKKTFESVGFSLPDVQNISRVYLCSFLGLCKIENNPSRMLDFERKYQRKNNTDSSPNPELIFRKNRSDLSTFLKQKLPMLASVCSRKSRNIVVDCAEKFYFKTKVLVEVNEEALKTAPYGYKGYLSINEEEFKTAQKQSHSKGKKRFTDGEYHYFMLDRQPAPFFTLDKIAEIDIEEDVEFCSGIIEKSEEISSLWHDFESLPRIERIEMLEVFIKKNKKNKLAQTAREILEELK